MNSMSYWLQKFSTGFAERRFWSNVRRFEWFYSIARNTLGLRKISMKLKNTFRPSILMEIIHILSENKIQKSNLFEFSKNLMPRIWGSIFGSGWFRDEEFSNKDETFDFKLVVNFPGVRGIFFEGLQCPVLFYIISSESRSFDFSNKDYLSQIAP